MVQPICTNGATQRHFRALILNANDNANDNEDDDENEDDDDNEDESA